MGNILLQTEKQIDHQDWKLMRKHLPLLLAVALSAFTPLAAHASLIGLSGVSIGDPLVPSTLSAVNVTKKEIKKEITTVLRTVNIPETKGDYPLLTIQITATETSMDIYAFSIDIQVYDIVQRTNAAKTREAAIIWSDGTLGTADDEDLPGNIKGSLDQLLGHFALQYASDNPAAGVTLFPTTQPNKRQHGNGSDNP
jgi:hypothetical protein